MLYDKEVQLKENFKLAWIILKRITIQVKLVFLFVSRFIIYVC